MNNTALEVSNLKTYFYTRKGVVKAVDGVSFEIRRGEIFGLVGESGCGKSVTALSIIKLIPKPPGEIVGGNIVFDGETISDKNEAEMTKVRGRKISMIFQDPLTSLDPIMKIGTQIEETIKLHSAINKEKAKQRVLQVLKDVGIPDPALRVEQFPFQLSGGMRQRVMIAIALAANPELLLADEPTTNLDVTIQAQILELLRNIRNNKGVSILLITHNLGIVAWMCNRVAVMYAGKIVEYGKTKEVFKNPMHPYTTLLLKSIPRLDHGRSRLDSIEGDVPDLLNVPIGCRFHTRCPNAKQICINNEPALTELESEHHVSCLMYNKEIWDKR